MMGGVYVKIMIGLAVSALIIVLQWITVIGFIIHSHERWIKTNYPSITAAIFGAIVFAVCSLMSVGFCLWAHGELYRQKSNVKYIAQLIGIAGLSGLLVFSGMVSFGYIMLVHR